MVMALYSYGLHSYGLSSYGLYSYGLVYTVMSDISGLRYLVVEPCRQLCRAAKPRRQLLVEPM